MQIILQVASLLSVRKHFCTPLQETVGQGRERCGWAKSNRDVEKKVAKITVRYFIGLGEPRLGVPEAFRIAGAQLFPDASRGANPKVALAAYELALRLELSPPVLVEYKKKKVDDEVIEGVDCGIYRTG